MTNRISGWHMTAIFVAFFGIVIAVNVTMATLAVRTFGGTVVENSYVASQEFNGWLKAARKQQQLGWNVTSGLDAQRHVIVTTDVAGAEVSGFARHPLGRAPDVRLAFGKGLRSGRALPSGRWEVYLTVRKGRDEVRTVETLS